MKWDHVNEGEKIKLYNGGAIEVIWLETDAERAQFATLMKAMSIYAKRNARYNDNWRRMGYRGLLVRIRERAERLWDAFWDGEYTDGGEAIPADDALDLINFAAFFARAILDSEATRDGSWW